MMHLITNPHARAGEDRELVRQVRRGLGDRACCVCPFPFESHLSDHRRRRGSDERIVVVGGDGTMNRVLNALGPYSPPVALIAAGTANDLAAGLGLPDDPWIASELAATGTPRPVDLISVNGRLFATCGGIGLPARAARLANRWRSGHTGPRLARKLGRKVYVLAAMAELARSRRALRVRVDDGTSRSTEEVLALLVSNQARLGGRYLVSPAACARDGRLDLCSVLRPRGAGASLSLVREVAAGRVAALPFVQHRQAASLTIRVDRPVPFFGDGEVLCEDDTFHLDVLPSALHVVTPSAEEVLRAAA